MLPLCLRLAIHHGCRRNDCLVSLTLDRLSLAALTLGNIRTPNAVSFQRLAKLTVEVNRIIGFAIAVAPATTCRRAFHPAANRMLIYHLHKLFGRGAAHSARQVDLNACLFVSGKSEAQYTSSRRGRHLGADVIISQGRGIIACPSNFGLV